jgi:methionyl-tRNA synthetase
VPWGIPWPDDPDHTVYVWFDAVINYLSATGFPDAGFERVWPADVHIIGPDIVRFHAALWPAMLYAAGLEPPRGVWCHGWVNLQGARFSKSAGVRLTLREAIDRHGPDALRYFLLAEIPWDGDGNFTLERFDARYVADLADGYGNLVSRVLAMIARYRDGVVPPAGATDLDAAARDAWTRYAGAMDQHLLHEGAAAVVRLVSEANGFIERSAPWALAKAGDANRLDPVLASLAACVAQVTLMLSPFLPTKTTEVWRALGTAPDDVTMVTYVLPTMSGRRVGTVAPLFPKPRVAA